MELWEPVVHVLEGEIVRGDSRAFEDLAAAAGALFLHLVQCGYETASLAPARCVIQDVDRFLLEVPGTLGGCEQISRGTHDRYVIVEQVRGLGDPARGLVVLRRDLLRPVLRPVTLGEPQPVTPRVRDERCHHVVVLAVLSAVLGELDCRAVARGCAPHGTHGARSRYRIVRVGTALVVAAREVMPALENKTGVREPVADRLGGDHYGIRHAARTVHRQPDVRELGHVLQDPFGAQLGDAVQGCVGLVVGVDRVPGQLLPTGPEGTGGRALIHHESVDVLGPYARILDCPTQRGATDGAERGPRFAVPAPGCRTMSDPHGGYFPAVFPYSQSLPGPVHRLRCVLGAHRLSPTTRHSVTTASGR